jgi:hypothetical protein
VQVPATITAVEFKNTAGQFTCTAANTGTGLFLVKNCGKKAGAIPRNRIRIRT